MKNEIKPKILLIDIETQPNLAWVWGKWEQNVIEFKQEWCIISFAYKWLGEKKTHVMALPDFKGYKPNTANDKKLILYIYKLFDEASIIIAQNGDAFDIKKINTRFIYYGLKPTSPYKTVDTLKVAKNQFSFSSNSLNELGKYLGLGEKKETHGFKTWLGCMNGDKKSWDIMRKYNSGDIELLEKVYMKLLPWIKNHPTMGLYNGKPISCPNCGSEHLQVRGTQVNKTCRYKRLHCQDCGTWSKTAHKEEQKEKPLVGV